jgi:hypothetical protein
MASYNYTFTSGDTVTPTKLNSARTVSDIVNADVSATAALAHTKLASITAGQVLLGNASNVPTATALSGDVTVNSSGVTAISSGVIVDADVNATAAISLSKLATGALPTAITVASANLMDGTIVNADINASAAIDLSKLATGALPPAITVASANLVDGTIVDADINASASIADTKLATISTSGKISNSATTATNANTANAIVARDASGNFSAGTITASLSGNVTGNVTGNLTGTASAIADGIVSTAKIVDGNVTDAKLATGIDASKLTTGTLPIARIADAAVTPAKLSQPLTLATAQATTSGTSINFTGIPSWARRITMVLRGVNSSSSATFSLRVGTSSGIVETGYVGASDRMSAEGAGTLTPALFSTGFTLNDAAMSAPRHGVCTLINISANDWVFSVVGSGSGATTPTIIVGAGSISLGGVLDRVALTTSAGTFNAGSVNIMYEG